MAYFNTTLGYTTQNGEWEILTDKELAKHDLLMLLHTRKGECDWDPSLGTTILDKMFRPKTEALKTGCLRNEGQAHSAEVRARPDGCWTQKRYRHPAAI